jgi:hypothetical protein
LDEIEIHSYKALITGFITFLVIFFGAKCTLSSFFKQKEYELVRDRYLTHSLDVVRKYNLNLMESYAKNFHEVNQTLGKVIHDDQTLDVKNTINNINYLDDASICGFEYTRITRLLNDETLWTLNQILVANIVKENIFLKSVLEQLRINETPCKKKAEEYNIKVNTNFENILSEAGIITGFLTEITDIFEEKRFNFSTIRNFSKDVTVVSMLVELRSSLKEK